MNGRVLDITSGPMRRTWMRHLRSDNEVARSFLEGEVGVRVALLGEDLRWPGRKVRWLSSETSDELVSGCVMGVWGLARGHDAPGTVFHGYLEATFCLLTWLHSLDDDDRVRVAWALMVMRRDMRDGGRCPRGIQMWPPDSRIFGLTSRIR